MTEPPNRCHHWVPYVHVKFCSIFCALTFGANFCGEIHRCRHVVANAQLNLACKLWNLLWNLLWSAPLCATPKIWSNFLVLFMVSTQSPLPKSKTRSPMIIALHPNKIKRNIPEQFWKIFPTAATTKNHQQLRSYFLNMYVHVVMCI